MTETSTRPSPGPVTGGSATIRVGIIGAAGIAGGELVRLLERHPNVRIAGLQGRDRDHQPLADSQPQLGRTGHYIETSLPQVDAVFMALPHGASAAIAPEYLDKGVAVIDLGSDYRLSDPAEYERWLRRVLDDFTPYGPGENLVFLNAWNEWAEGNHLEPCLRWGRGYLEATRRALEGRGA